MTHSVTVHIDAAPEAVYDLVADVTRMGEWSPECVGCEWLDGATTASVGARFKGRNKRKGSWSSTSTITQASRGVVFGWDVSGETAWRYEFAPAAGGGCDVTESFEILKVPGRAGRMMTKLGTGVPWSEREADMVEGMRVTLARLREAAGRLDSDV